MGDTDVPRSSKQAARETSKAIGRARKQAVRTAVAQGESIRASLLLSETRSETEGKDALSNLRRLRGGKLRDGDEVIIARRLYGEVQNLKQNLRARDILLRDFCSLIGIDLSGSSKELHRLTLAPDQNAASVRLRKSADKYYSLITGISEYGNRSINTLADDVLRGTSLHPSVHLGEMSEAEKLATALQLIVDKIDREFNLYEKYMKTARLRSEYILAGSKEYWPLWGPLEEEDQQIRYMKIAADLRFSYWDKPGYYDEEWAKISNEEMEDRSFPVFPEPGILQGEELFYIPHAPFGVLEFADIGRRPRSVAGLVDYKNSVDRALFYWRDRNTKTGMSQVEIQESISDDWDEINLCPKNQIIFDPISATGNYFAWFIIYPTRDNSRLMLMLYIAWEEGGSYVLPLNARNLEIFRDALWLNQTEEKSAFDRIKDLLGYRSGEDRFLERRLRHTAPWFDHNPIFKIAREKAADLKALDAFCASFWQDADFRHTKSGKEN